MVSVEEEEGGTWTHSQQQQGVEAGGWACEMATHLPLRLAPSMRRGS
jgi:hypothetical protein